MERTVGEWVILLNKSTAELAASTERIKKNNEQIEKDLKIMDEMLKELVGEDKVESSTCDIVVDKLIEKNNSEIENFITDSNARTEKSIKEILDETNELLKSLGIE
jgi:hypothetical protein